VATAARGANVRHQLRALTGGRLGGSARTLLAFGVGFVAIIGIAVAIVAIVAPTAKRLCRPYQPCGPPRFVKPLVAETLWRSSEFGYTFEYSATDFQVAQAFPDGATLTGQDPSSGNSIAIIIRAAPAGRTSPSQAVTNLLANVNGVAQIGGSGRRLRGQRRVPAGRQRSGRACRRGRVRRAGGGEHGRGRWLT